MTLFHRFAVPTYAGGLPAGYDFINNAGGGTPAFADGAKTAGPNAGTYFVAFGEDATSSDVNRPAQALAQNCDFLDDTLHRDIALPVRTSTGTGAPTASLLITGPGIFMGLAGAAIGNLFQVTDANDEAITVGDTEIVIASAVDSGSVPVGGGFSLGNVTVTFNIAVPSGQTYHVWYGERTNFATFPADGLTTSRIRSLTEIDAEIEELFYNLHGNNLAWNAAWTSTIWDLSAGGLNERYSRQTSTASLTPPESYWSSLLATAGSGSWIKRTGPAVTVYSAGDTSALSDPINALFAAKSVDTVAITSGGVVGFAAYGTRRSNAAFAPEVGTGRTPGAALFIGLWPHDFTTSSSFYTNIVAGSAVSLANVSAYDPNTGTAQVTLTAPSYSNNGTTSAIAVGYDLLELQYFISGVQHNETVVIVGISTGSPLLVDVRYPNGTVPDWSTITPTSATVRWVSTSFAVGDGAGSFHHGLYGDTTPVLLDGLFYQVPPPLGPSSGLLARVPASFSASNNANNLLALQWGGLGASSTFTPVFPSSLRGDGSMQVTATQGGTTGGLFTGAATGNASGLSGVAGGTGAGTGVLGSGGAGTGVGGGFTGGSSNGDGAHGTGIGTGTGLAGFGGDQSGTGVNGQGGADDGRDGGGIGGSFVGGDNEFALGGGGVEAVGGVDAGAGGGTGSFGLGGTDNGVGGGIGCWGQGGSSASEILAGAGVVGIGGGSNIPAFSAYQGYGGYFLGGVGSNTGTHGTGTGTAAGVTGQGGPTSTGGAGGSFTGGGSSGRGVIAQGAGTGAGIAGIGGGTSTGGAGGSFSGGGTAGPGVIGFGSGTGAGGRFEASGSTTNPALYAALGPLHVDFLVPGGATVDPAPNRLYGDNIIKCFGQVICQAGSGSTIESGFNISSMSTNGGGTQLTITMNRPLTNFAVVCNCSNGGAPQLVSTTSGVTSGSSFVILSAASMIGAYVSFTVVGPEPA